MSKITESAIEVPFQSKYRRIAANMGASLRKAVSYPKSIQAYFMTIFIF